MRIAVVNKDRCQPRQCSTECIKYCPRVRTGDETITFNETGKIQISEELCVGCGICVKKCYFNAITIISLPEILKNPIHRYSENGFALFGLPIPQKGKVTGILGQNGIGKSTTIKILSGSLIPNFGNKTSSKDDVLSYYSGTSLYDHFKKIFENKIIVSQKPQYIDQIPKVFFGTVENLFEKNNLDIQQLKSIIQELNIDNLLYKKLDVLSGGELQRVAIAVCVSKNADLYFFDEVSSYLDIYQRIQISKIIKRLSKQKSVIVIEHDLALLDLLADTVHITYGQSGCYGVITLPKTIKSGINQYIKGFLNEENIRIRNEEIKFEEHPPKITTEIKELISYNSFSQSIGETFKLNSNSGYIMEGEVIGIVGPNGIGKTSFVKMISGILKTEINIFNTKCKVSYKPQYIKPDENMKVRDFFSKINSSIFCSSYFQVELEKALHLDELYDLYLSNLSGGELQRVAITGCLIKEADIYVFDEPSAHLDVEQRSNVTKVISRFTENHKKTTMVVDHDIYMIDMLSQRLIVFDGKPTKYGNISSPMNMNTGMNLFLSMLDITFRRDEETKRPRINNYLSRLDREQKEKGNYYYAK